VEGHPHPPNPKPSRCPYLAVVARPHRRSRNLNHAPLSAAVSSCRLRRGDHALRRDRRSTTSSRMNARRGSWMLPRPTQSLSQCSAWIARGFGELRPLGVLSLETADATYATWPKLSGARCSALYRASSLRRATRVAPAEDFAQCFAEQEPHAETSLRRTMSPTRDCRLVHQCFLYCSFTASGATGAPATGRQPQRRGRRATGTREGGPVARTTRSVRYEALRTKNNNTNRLFNIQHPTSINLPFRSHIPPTPPLALPANHHNHPSGA
jgi:hypothetical protein